MNEGMHWVVDAWGCDAESLRSRERLAAVFDAAVRELRLKPVDAARWHVFPGEAGVTGFLVLAESHLACHTFPETGFAAFDLYCCRPRDEWAWEARLREHLGARRVEVRCVSRGKANR